MTAHSALGPSAAHRWKACPGSVNAERLVRLANPDADGSSPFAEEGTRAHELCETLLNNPELPLPGDDIETMEDVDMLRHCLRYRDYCLNVAGESAMTFVEERVTMPRVHPDCFGTADFIAYRPEYKHLHIIDLKYGAGQFVEVHENPQAMLYAEGARQMMWDRHKISPRFYTVHIFQPRAMQGENIANYQFKNTRLDDFVTETAAQAIATQTDIDTFNPGDKQCHWCLANPCRARQQQMHDMLAEEFDELDDHDITDTMVRLIAESPLMTDAELSDWLAKAGSLKAFVAKIEALAYERAMDHHVLPGFKLVEGRGSYKPNREALEFILGDEVYQPPKLRSMTDLRKHLGTRAFDDTAKMYFRRMPGKPTLVKEDDPRREWSETADIKDMLDDL